MDGGNIYIPIEHSNLSSSVLNYTFKSTYDKYTEVKIRCKATNVKGFSDIAGTVITLERKSNANAMNDLQIIDPSKLETEMEYIQAVNQVKLITKYLGDLDEMTFDYFDPKIELGNCNNKLCNNRGNCIY